jgi:hypothetical protein
MAAPDIEAQIESVVSKGRAEFPDFDDRSAFVVGLTANRGELREAIGSLPAGHHVIAALADNPDEAARILSLRGTKFGTALGQFAATKAPNAPARAAQPASAQPTVPDIHDSKLSMAAWTAAMDQRAAQRREAARAAPTNTNLYDPSISAEDFDKAFEQRWTARLARRRAR